MARTAATVPAGVRLADYISLGVLTTSFPLDTVQAVLAENGFAHQAPAVWRGRLAGLPVIAYTLCVDTALSMLHLWWAAPDGDTPPAALFAAARRLRADVEAALA